MANIFISTVKGNIREILKRCSGTEEKETKS
jgi:hypothetical protein